MKLINPFVPPEPEFAYPEIGSIDRVTAVIGARGTGKSTWALGDAIVWQRRTGGYILGHSPGGRLPTDVVSHGIRADIAWHGDLVSMARGLRRQPGRVHVMSAGSVEELVAFARSTQRRAVERAVRGAGHRRWRPGLDPIPKGVSAPPMLVLVDEGTAMRDAKRGSDESREWEVFLTGLRHEHVALTWLTQAPTARSWRLIEQANRIAIFRYTHQWGFNALSSVGVPQSDLERMRTLDRGKFLLYDMRIS